MGIRDEVDWGRRGRVRGYVVRGQCVLCLFIPVRRRRVSLDIQPAKLESLRSVLGDNGFKSYIATVGGDGFAVIRSGKGIWNDADLESAMV
jgi:hypothetical protein